MNLQPQIEELTRKIDELTAEAKRLKKVRRKLEGAQQLDLNLPSEK